MRSYFKRSLKFSVLHEYVCLFHNFCQISVVGVRTFVCTHTHEDKWTFGINTESTHNDHKQNQKETTTTTMLSSRKQKRNETWMMKNNTLWRKKKELIMNCLFLASTMKSYCRFFLMTKHKTHTHTKFSNWTQTSFCVWIDYRLRLP